MRLHILSLVLLPAPALAHGGHLGALAGHDHWVAGAAVGIALGIGLWAAAKDRKRGKPAADEAVETDSDTPEEQPA